jgi:hypothetical protein
MDVVRPHDRRDSHHAGLRSQTSRGQIPSRSGTLPAAAHCAISIATLVRPRRCGVLGPLCLLKLTWRFRCARRCRTNRYIQKWSARPALKPKLGGRRGRFPANSGDPDQSEKADLEQEGDGRDGDRKKRFTRRYGGYGGCLPCGPRFVVCSSIPSGSPQRATLENLLTRIGHFYSELNPA